MCRTGGSRFSLIAAFILMVWGEEFKLMPTKQLLPSHGSGSRGAARFCGLSAKGCTRTSEREWDMQNRYGIVMSVSVLVVCVVAMYVSATPHARTEQAVGVEGSCDYTCLTGFVDRYLKALAAHDPHLVPATDHVRFTENTISLTLGDALWGTISGMGSYRLFFADPHAGEVGFEGTIRENGTPAILMLRLRVVNHKITEVETLVHRNAQDAEALERLAGPNPAWLQPVPPSEQTSRQDMEQDANLYFDGILHSSSAKVPFDPQCNRVLDGEQDTNNPSAKGWWDTGTFRPASMGIGENMNTGIWAYIQSIDPRRYLVLDERMGIVFGVFMFNHPGTVKWADVPGVGQVPMPAITQRPSSVEMGEFFKIERGKIRQIEGVSVALPYRSSTGWDRPGE
jgi:hypothetical protein